MKKLLAIVAVIIVMVAMLYSCAKKKMENKVIDTVRTGYFYEVSEDVTVGAMLNKICTRGKWDLILSESGIPSIHYTGLMDGMEVKLYFFVYPPYDSQFRLDVFSFGGKAITRGVSPHIDSVPYYLFERYKSTVSK